MSKIAQAVEKAKQQREELLTAQAQEQRTESRQPEPVQPELVAVPARPAYRQTRALHSEEALLERNRILGGIHDPATVDAYTLLRARIIERTREAGGNTIMITSPLPREGKTLTAINLTVSFGKDSTRTALLVDTNLRNPMVGRYLGLPEHQGLSDYFLDDIPIPDLLVKPDMGKMVVLPAGRAITGSTEMLDSPKMKQLVAEMKHRYPDRYVIFDCPHLLNMPDSLVFSSYVDGVVLVVEAGRTAKKDIRAAVEMLKGRNLLGVVMNRSHTHV
jgi:exopolysaccharide/PEP-CTERM locus tyrosine autokinase